MFMYWYCWRHYWWWCCGVDLVATYFLWCLTLVVLLLLLLLNSYSQLKWQTCCLQMSQHRRLVHMPMPRSQPHLRRIDETLSTKSSQEVRRKLGSMFPSRHVSKSKEGRVLVRLHLWLQSRLWKGRKWVRANLYRRGWVCDVKRGMPA